ncbi:NAD-dependent epimerase/dehydratase family protein [Pseudohoeflea suaedae]|uniref:NAD-dependent epimerase/dehydratase family protein n=1 Tax=Pseudohoeflea suaedae TaxID=877384 RepID=A0A4R5PNJ1_9HYPH|nr:NAD-dependent epimerase/dehydratase family protein [Pseudohoeflea suaedae]TDH38127.1 NAD-dependent epimerase/dehydratase family protein [Pseudohoeflea suaedae]
MNDRPYLVTGAAGFVGYHVVLALLARGDTVIGIDNINGYYDPALKEARLGNLAAGAATKNATFIFERMDISDTGAVAGLFERHHPFRVVHLAAQAGVRHSIENPGSYVQSNLVGFANILESCRNAGIDHLTYASSSSVYGANGKRPFSEHDNADHPVQFYAATKRANELMAHAYSSLHRLPTTGLRFFTVYGPWGRPDMAYFSFARKILGGEPIQLYNFGRQSRDFTYIDDVVATMLDLCDRPARGNDNWRPEHPDPQSSAAPFRLVNIGSAKPHSLGALVGALEAALGVKAEIEYLPPQPGDISDTHADISNLSAYIGSAPSTPLDLGISRFAEWYRDFYNA